MYKCVMINRITSSFGIKVWLIMFFLIYLHTNNEQRKVKDGEQTCCQEKQ